VRPDTDALASMLRPHRPAAAGPPGDQPPRVLRVDPADGSTGVFLDVTVVVTLSHPVDASSVGPATVCVRSGGEPAPGGLAVSPDGTIVIWTALLPLNAGALHVLTVSGVTDRAGREVLPHRTTFHCGPHTLQDLLESHTG
jgi:hypothetical protein